MPKYKRYNMLSGEKKKTSKKRLIVFLLLGLILFAGLVFALERKDIINLPFSADNKPVSSPTGINYDPPTKQEKNETEQLKEKLGEETTPSTTPTSPTTTKKSVTPIMTSWIASPNVEVRGYIPDINEEGGTCTLSLTLNGQEVTESKAATADAKSVSCGLVSVARSRLTAGKWTATLSYSSQSSEGISASNTIEVE